MSPMLHLASTVGMVIFTVIGLCCSLAAARGGRAAAWRPTSDVFVMAAMAVAMVDVAVPSVTLLPNAVWALILVVGGPAAAAASGVRTRRGPAVDQFSTALDLHRGVSSVAMGVLVLFIHADAPGDLLAPLGAHAHGGLGAPVWVLTAGIVAFAVFSVYVVRGAVGAARGAGAAHAVEALASVAAVGCMAAMLY
ncbi:hypothetical protein [Specibacter sp. RAF43]|uniref:hypothetical protein n=1 Tax=Specibacter sp. RAF43 TaxID=3233057 RepID=UPI003F95F006